MANKLRDPGDDENPDSYLVRERWSNGEQVVRVSRACK